jgi:hypothetical protein
MNRVQSNPGNGDWWRAAAVETLEDADRFMDELRDERDE